MAEKVDFTWFVRRRYRSDFDLRECHFGSKYGCGTDMPFWVNECLF